MNEIEKMYELAGVKPINIAEYGSTYIPKKIEINGKPYPPFTAEKQLELIKLIANRKGYPDYEHFGSLFDDYIQFRDFNEALAKVVNLIWQDLTEEEKEQIKEILG